MFSCQFIVTLCNHVPQEENELSECWIMIIIITSSPVCLEPTKVTGHVMKAAAGARARAAGAKRHTDNLPKTQSAGRN